MASPKVSADPRGYTESAARPLLNWDQTMQANKILKNNQDLQNDLDNLSDEVQKKEQTKKGK